MNTFLKTTSHVEEISFLLCFTLSLYKILWKASHNNFSLRTLDLFVVFHNNFSLRTLNLFVIFHYNFSFRTLYFFVVFHGETLSFFWNDIVHWAVHKHILNASFSADFVIYLRESFLTVEASAHLVIQFVVEHLPIFFPSHVRVRVHHLESVGRNK